MRRRRYVQTTALALTGGLAGCSDLAADDPTDTPTETATETETATPTETPEPTPREEPPNIDPPQWLELIPREHFADSASGDPASAVFSKLDWDWYLNHRYTQPSWGPAEEDSWSFAPTEVNRRLPPSANILTTPHWGAWLVGVNAEVDVFREDPTLGPELRRQCGLTEDFEPTGDAIVDEVVMFSRPAMTHFIGADTDAVRAAMASAELETEPYKYDGYDAIEYISAAESATNIVVSDEWSRGVVGVVTGSSGEEDTIDPEKGRLLNDNSVDSIAEEESVQWGLGRLVDAPVVTGELNGIRFNFTGEGRSDRGVERLEPFDTLLTSMDASKFSGVIQHIFTRVEGEAPSSEALRESFETESGTWSTQYHPSVSDIDASW